ncbi:MAG: PadR family transcriptional regulator [Patescibacteria group bacterium]|nr:PadR family transcriptional regulator [Patescibacteria group bacterium]
MKTQKLTKGNIPLSPQIFYVLLSLAIKQRHGYEIMKQVQSDSQGKIKLGPGTLYGAIKRMLEEKLIIEITSDKQRRRVYKLADKGRAIFQSELQRYNEAVELARQKKLLISPLINKFTLVYG